NSSVTAAGEADGYVVSVLAADGKGATDSSLYYVEKGAPGFTVEGRFDGLGMRGNASAPMRLRKTPVEAADLLSAPGGGFAAMMDVVLPWFQIGTAAVSIGIAEAALAATATHLGAARLEHL